MGRPMLRDASLRDAPRHEAEKSTAIGASYAPPKPARVSRISAASSAERKRERSPAANARLRPQPEEPAEGGRLEGWGGPCFETHRFAMLLSMRPRKALRSARPTRRHRSASGRDTGTEVADTRYGNCRRRHVLKE